MQSSTLPAVPGPGLHDLPEEDQEENFELPTLPENKDPLQHTISLQKKQANSKRIVRSSRVQPWARPGRVPSKWGEKLPSQNAQSPPPPQPPPLIMMVKLTMWHPWGECQNLLGFGASSPRKRELHDWSF